MSTLTERLISLIGHTGPMSVAQYMAACLFDPDGGYYARAPKIGADGDFITAPEISQMFGEIIGAWCAHEWTAMGQPNPFHLIEFGPGTGALMSDVLRTGEKARGFLRAAQVHLIEASAPLRVLQEATLKKTGAAISWCARLEDVPAGASLLIGNEFLDCLPIRQFVRRDGAWRERLVGVVDGRLAFGLSAEGLEDLLGLPEILESAPDGAIAEIASEAPAFTRRIAARLHADPGRALFLDYGGDGSGDTLQAIKAHQKIGPLAAAGESDLTARVDFTTFGDYARGAGLNVHGPVSQGAWLTRLGIEARAAALIKARADQQAPIERALHRLTHPDEMGVLFQVQCLSSPLLPAPAGF